MKCGDFPWLSRDIQLLLYMIDCIALEGECNTTPIGDFESDLGNGSNWQNFNVGIFK